MPVLKWKEVSYFHKRIKYIYSSPEVSEGKVWLGEGILPCWHMTCLQVAPLIVSPLCILPVIHKDQEGTGQITLVNLNLGLVKK